MSDKTAMLRNRVKELRTRLKIRQVDLAREAGVTRQTIIAVEKERLNPSITVCLNIARALREPVDYIFFLEREPEAPEPVLDIVPPEPVEDGPAAPEEGMPAAPEEDVAPAPAEDMPPTTEDDGPSGAPQSVFDFG